MSKEPTDDTERETRFNEILVEYYQAVESGQTLGKQEFLARHLDFGAELDEFFADRDRFEELAEPLTPFGDAVREVRRVPIEAANTPTTLSTEPATDRATTDHYFGDYELLEEIARGGMGIVYKARQVSLNRIVALKMILSGQLATEDDIKRFQIEAEAAANLHHPHIIPIYEVGKQDGQHYFSMEYVDGTSLSQMAREGPLSPKRAARYVQQVAEAIDYGHQCGVTHRDIKPSNVLVDSADRARVTDFGLAKRVEEEGDLTATGQPVGTPPYMSPEQIAGRRDQIGPISDVYSLGALFYELLTGRPPFGGKNSLETFIQIRERCAKLPRQLNPHVPRELEMICMKCLEKDPKDRYPSARAMASDLNRFLSGDSISISSTGLFERVFRTLERGHHDVEFQTWSRMLFHFAWIVLVAHGLVFALVQYPLRHALLWLGLVRVAKFSGMAIVLWACRRDWYPPCGKPSRQLWALWLGYLAGSISLALVEYTLSSPQRPFEEWMLYPRLAILASLGFIMMGSSYWGYCYLIGGGFIVLALGMVWSPDAAPLVFGMAWAASLIALSRHLKKLAREP